MADDRLTSYADIPALEAEQTKIIKLVDDTITHIQSKQKELGGIQISLLDANTAKESTEAINKGKKSVDELTLSVREYKKLQDQLATTEAKLAVAQTDTARALAATRVELQATNKLNKDGISAYNELQTQLAAASRLYKDLAASRGLDNKATLEAQKRAVDLNNQLKAIDAGMGNYQRNVGNYSSAVSGLQFSFRNIAGELPNLGISLRTFGMAISNNITPLVDNIAALKKENVALVASGKPAISLGKQIASSFLSWNTAVSLLIVGGLQLIEYFTKANKEQEKMSEVAKENAEAQKRTADSIGKEVASLKSLVTIAADTRRTYRERGDAVDELQKKFPTYFAAIDREAVLNGKVATATNLATQAIINKAKETARIEKFTKAVTDLAQLELELETMTSKTKGTFKYYTSEEKTDLERKIATKRREVEELDKGIKVQNQAGAAEAYWLDGNAQKQHKKNVEKEKALALMTEEERKEFLKPKKDTTQSEEDKKAAAAKKRSEDLAATIMQQMNDIALKESQITEKSLDALLTSFEKQEVGLKEYGNKKEQIVKQSEDRILKYQIDSLMTYLKAEGLLPDEIAKIQEKITDLTIKQTQKTNNAREAAAETTAKNLMGFQSAMYKDAAERAKAQADLEKKIADETTKYKKELEQELINFVETAIMASYERRIRAAEDEGEKIKEKSEIEIEAINNSTLSQVEKDRRIEESKAITAEKEKENERKIAAIKNQAAKTEKAITIGKIIAQTALNEVSALQYLTNPITAPLYPALAILIGALGAAQVATVLATPLPKYAEGTSDHKGGLAILGDGKEHELVIEPNKKPYWSANTDTLYNLPKHTQVIPESKLGSAVTQPSNKDVVNAVMEMSGLIDGGLNKLNRTIRNKETVRLEAKNRRWQDYYYENAKA